MEQRQKKISIVITPLNLLGKQNAGELERAGIPAIAVCKENATAEVFKVRMCSARIVTWC